MSSGPWRKQHPQDAADLDAMKAPKVAAREAKWERARKLIAEGLTNAQIQERLGLQGYVLKQLREDAKP